MSLVQRVGIAFVVMLVLLLDTAGQHDRVAAWSRTIDSERALGLALMDDLPSLYKLSRGFSGGAVEYLDLMQRFEDLGKQSWGTQPGAISSDWMAALLDPAMKGALEANRRVQAQTNALLILAAWQDAGSDAAATIGELGLPKSIVTDPFDGSTMKFKMTDVGPIIYAVGVDGTDNDGDVPNSDAGIAPIGS